MHDLDQNFISYICGAPAMFGTRRSPLCQNAVSPRETNFHRHLLSVNFASRRRSEELDNVTKEVVKVVNSIIAGWLSNSIFSQTCSDTGSESKYVIYHSEVR